MNKDQKIFVLLVTVLVLQSVWFVYIINSRSELKNEPLSIQIAPVSESVVKNIEEVSSRNEYETHADESKSLGLELDPDRGSVKIPYSQKISLSKTFLYSRDLRDGQKNLWFTVDPDTEPKELKLPDFAQEAPKVFLQGSQKILVFLEEIDSLKNEMTNLVIHRVDLKTGKDEGVVFRLGQNISAHLSGRMILPQENTLLVALKDSLGASGGLYLVDLKGDTEAKRIAYWGNDHYLIGADSRGVIYYTIVPGKGGAIGKLLAMDSNGKEVVLLEELKKGGTVTGRYTSPDGKLMAVIQENQEGPVISDCCEATHYLPYGILKLFSLDVGSFYTITVEKAKEYYLKGWSADSKYVIFEQSGWPKWDGKDFGSIHGPIANVGRMVTEGFLIFNIENKEKKFVPVNEFWNYIAGNNIDYHAGQDTVLGFGSPENVEKFYIDGILADSYKGEWDAGPAKFNLLGFVK
jgi:hypothetical protein